MKKVVVWYRQNLEKILLISIFFTAFMIVVPMVPYVSFLFPSELRIIILLLIWYFLFSPSTKKLVFFSWILLSMSAISSSLQLNSISEYLGNPLFFFLVLIFMNYVKEMYKKEIKA